jgi:hypothetical protein
MQEVQQQRRRYNQIARWTGGEHRSVRLWWTRITQADDLPVPLDVAFFMQEQWKQMTTPCELPISFLPRKDWTNIYDEPIVDLGFFVLDVQTSTLRWKHDPSQPCSTTSQILYLHLVMQWPAHICQHLAYCSDTDMALLVMFATFIRRRLRRDTDDIEAVALFCSTTTSHEDACTVLSSLLSL